jgi:hypothetical protein
VAIGNYLPSYDKERVAWFRNFISKFSQYAPELCFTPFEVAGIRSDCATIASMADAVSVLKNGVGKSVAFKNPEASGESETQLIDIPSSPVPSAPAIPAGVFRRLSMTIRRIKSHPSYTEVMGAALGIHGEYGSAGPEAGIQDHL